MATANDDAMPGVTSTQIDLTWNPPAEIGESAITGYKIDWSADGNAPWIGLEANHAEMLNGKIVTAYSDTGLPPETTRYYRVSAINGDGAGSPSNVYGATSADIAGPKPVSASVTGSGTGIAIVFDEALDGDPAKAPAADRFTVSVNGVPAAVGSVAVWSALKQVVLGGFSPAIRSPLEDQTVTVTVAYTDVSDGDDATGVIQDGDGNDAEPFTLPRTLPREILVTNGATRPVSEPDAPESLMAESGQDRILLTWDPPADYGGSPITGYLVERSADVDPRVWRKLASNHEETAYEGRRRARGSPRQEHRRHPALPGLGDQRDRHRRPVRSGEGHHRDGPGRRAGGADGHGGGRHPDRPRLEGARGRGRVAGHGLPDRVVGRRQRAVGGAGRGHRQHGQEPFRHDGARLGDDAPLPGRGDQRPGHRPALGARARDHR